MDATTARFLNLGYDDFDQEEWHEVFSDRVEERVHDYVDYRIWQHFGLLDDSELARMLELYGVNLGGFPELDSGRRRRILEDIGYEMADDWYSGDFGDGESHDPGDMVAYIDDHFRLYPEEEYDSADGIIDSSRSADGVWHIGCCLDSALACQGDSDSVCYVLAMHDVALHSSDRYDALHALAILDAYGYACPDSQTADAYRTSALVDDFADDFADYILFRLCGERSTGSPKHFLDGDSATGEPFAAEYFISPWGTPCYTPTRHEAQARLDSARADS